MTKREILESTFYLKLWPKTAHSTSVSVRLIYKHPILNVKLIIHPQKRGTELTLVSGTFISSDGKIKDKILPILAA